MNDIKLTLMQRAAVDAALRGEKLPGLSAEAYHARLKRACIRKFGGVPKSPRGRRRVIFLGDLSDIAETAMAPEAHYAA